MKLRWPNRQRLWELIIETLASVAFERFIYVLIGTISFFSTRNLLPEPCPRPHPLPVVRLLILSLLVTYILLRVLPASRWWRFFAWALLFVCLGFTVMKARRDLYVPWRQERQLQIKYPFYIQVARFFTARKGPISWFLPGFYIDHFRSSKLRADLEFLLRTPGSNLETAGTGRLCRAFWPGHYDDAQRSRQANGAAMLVYGSLATGSAYCGIAVDPELLPPLHFDVTDWVQKEALKGPGHVSPNFAFAIDALTVEQSLALPHAVTESDLATLMLLCCKNGVAGVAYHMDQERDLGFDKQERAIELLERVVSMEACGPSSQVYALLGNAYFLRTKKQKAYEAWTRAQDEDPLELLARTNLGCLAYSRGDLDTAMTQLTAELPRWPGENLGLDFLLASLTAIMGHYDESSERWLILSELNPDDPIAAHYAGILQDLAWVSEEQTREWIERNILDALAHREMGIALVTRGRSEEGIDFLEAARELPFSEDLEFYTISDLYEDLHFWIGIAYGQQGDLERWKAEWDLIGLSPQQILCLSEEQQLYWKTFLGAQDYELLEPICNLETLLQMEAESIGDFFYRQQYLAPLMKPIY